MTNSIDQLRRAATALKKAYHGGDRGAFSRVVAHLNRAQGAPLKHADFLHVIARERGFASWPHLKIRAETEGLDRATRQQRLGQALAQGQRAVVQALLDQDPDLALGNIGLACRLFLRAEVKRLLAEDPSSTTRPAPLHPPLTMMAQSRALQIFPEREGDMLAIAGMLRAGGADVNHQVFHIEGDPAHGLSTLYFALGHAGNMPLSRWLLEQGADPNDGESLYHATELGHVHGVQMLLDHGADPRGTNAALRAMDFDDVAMVRMLLEAGAEVEDYASAPVGGEAPFVIPALHQAARRRVGPEMIALLLDHGADPTRVFGGLSAYAYARIYGHPPLAQALAARGADHPLDPVQAQLAAAAEGPVPAGTYLDPETLPPAARDILREILHLPGTLPQIQRLVEMGVEYDRPDAQGVTPVQVAGWEGLPEVMDYFLRLKPDLSHINGYGGTLFSTILHGAENCPAPGAPRPPRLPPPRPGRGRGPPAQRARPRRRSRDRRLPRRLVRRPSRPSGRRRAGLEPSAVPLPEPAVGCGRR